MVGQYDITGRHVTLLELVLAKYANCDLVSQLNDGKKNHCLLLCATVRCSRMRAGLLRNCLNRRLLFRERLLSLIATWEVLMAQLVVRNLDEDLVQRLKIRAAGMNRSAEEEHRQILQSVLSAPKRRLLAEVLTGDT